MAIIGRMLIILFGLASGIAIALIALPLLMLAEAFFGRMDWLEAFYGLIASIDDGEDLSADLLQALLSFLWTSAMMICAVPLILTGLAGEVAGLRTPLWYCCATGLLAASMPWLARAAFHLQETARANPLELRLALLFFLTGAAGGLVYWLIAGHGAGRPRTAVTR